VPAGLSALGARAVPGPRSWAKQAYPKLVHVNEPRAGDHVAAWQEFELFTSELRAAFRSQR